MQTPLHRRVFTSLVAFLVLATAAPAAATGGFGDVDAESYYADAVNWMVDEGITNGVETGCFGPNEFVSRGQVAAFLFRLDDSTGDDAQPHAYPFVDVVDGYQVQPVQWLYSAGISTGTSSTTFSPNDPITRGDFAVMLWRYAGKPAPGADHTFVDVHRDYQHLAISWMSEAGVTTGTSRETFSPEDPMTRGQAATFLYRHVSPSNFTLQSGVVEPSPCARELRNTLAAGGLTPSESHCVAPYLADFDIELLVKVVNDEARAPITLLLAVIKSIQAGCLSNARIADLTRVFL